MGGSDLAVGDLWQVKIGLDVLYVDIVDLVSTEIHFIESQVNFSATVGFREIDIHFSKVVQQLPGLQFRLVEQAVALFQWLVNSA